MSPQSNNIMFSLFILGVVWILTSCEPEHKTEEFDVLSPMIDSVGVGKDSSGQIMTLELAYLASYNKQYPKDAKLFADNHLAPRMQILMGGEYDYMMGVWAVESPIEVKGGYFVAKACEQHNCDMTNFIVVVEQKTDRVFVATRKEGEVAYYAEGDPKGNSAKNIAPIKAWLNGGD